MIKRNFKIGDVLTLDNITKVTIEKVENSLISIIWFEGNKLIRKQVKKRRLL